MQDFEKWLDKTSVDCGAISACCLDMTSPVFKVLVEEHAKNKQKWLDDGYGAELQYLYRQQAEKATPWQTFDAFPTIITITFSNDWGDPEANHPFPAVAEDALVGYISAYAKEQDYHRTGHEILRKIHSQLEADFGEEIEADFAVDTRPIYERFFAEIGGLGVLGPNDLLRTPERDVRVFIGTLFLAKKLPQVIKKPKLRFPCKFCNNCEESCPTGAITKGQPFDTAKCSSYMSIEKKGVITKDDRQYLDDWLFGCDWCTVVCPPKDKIDTRIPVDLEWLLKSSTGQLKRLIKGTAIEYAGVIQLRRNAVAILQGHAEKGNNKAQDLINWTRENTGSQLIIDQCDLT